VSLGTEALSYAAVLGQPDSCKPTREFFTDVRPFLTILRQRDQSNELDVPAPVFGALPKCPYDHSARATDVIRSLQLNRREVDCDSCAKIRHSSLFSTLTEPERTTINRENTRPYTHTDTHSQSTALRFACVCIRQWAELHLHQSRYCHGKKRPQSCHSAHWT